MCSRAASATLQAFENAMALDIAMGGSTNTVLHILALAQRSGVNFTMADIDHLSRRVPNICKVAPSSHHHVEDVHRAGGIFTILGELDRAGLIHREAKTVHAATMVRPLPKTTSIARRPAKRPESALWRLLPACPRKPPSRRKDTSQQPTPSGERLHPRRGPRLQQGWWIGGPLRQLGPGRLHRETAGVTRPS